MADKRNRNRRQHGFTLIEIIAVLVILGILAIVAIPKYFSLQDNARQQAANGLVASAQSLLSLYYANHKLNPTNYALTDANSICTNTNLPISVANSENANNTNVTCTGNIMNGNVNINASVSGQNANGTWTSPEAAAAAAS